MRGIQSLFHGVLNYSDENRGKVENIVLALWLFAVVASILTHELWRDETREYLMAVGIDNFAEYFNFAKYDGHPLLWRTILMAMHWLIPNPVVLQMASLLIGFLTVYLIVKHSPFPLIVKALFIFGVIPFSVNTVDARDYGISMLLFFTLAIFYTKAERHPITIGLLLFLEANTNQYGMYLSGLFIAGWVADSGFDILKERRVQVALLIALAGVLISLYSTRVDAESVFCPPNHIANIHYWHAFLKAVRHPGEYIYYILHVPRGYRDIFTVSLILALFVVRPYFGVLLFVAIVVFNFVGVAFIYPQTRHQGVLFAFIMMLFWIALYGIRNQQRTGLFRQAKTVFLAVLFILMVPFLVHEVFINNFIVHEEARVEKSTALAVGKYLATNKQLEKAIIIGSPEYALEPISFYSNNQIYLAQEGVFRDFVRFSIDYDKTSNLVQLLETAESLNAKYNVPIVIVLGFFGVEEGKTFPTVYRGNFNMTNIQRFKEETVKLAEFNYALGDEKFQVFLYLPHDELTQYKGKYMELR